MSSEYLPVFIQNALEDNLEMLPDILRGPTLREILAFCQNFRSAGIGRLFLDGTSTDFRHHLGQSGRAFAHFLLHAPESAKVGSRSKPFFDAVAAGDFEGARDIAQRSRRTWAQGKEYEEEFLFVEFCMQHAFLGASSDELQALLQRYEKALQGSEDFRLDVCKALLAADSDAFNESLERYLEARNDEWEELADSDGVAPEVLETEGHLSVEGLALVRLAERQGLATQSDYLHVPSLAREEGGARFEADSWQHIEVDGE